jgi:hypothetical protein
MHGTEAFSLFSRFSDANRIRLSNAAGNVRYVKNQATWS